MTCALLPASPARANLMLTLSEPTFATLTITDTLNTGALSYFGTYGDFSTNFVIGVSNKLTSPVPSVATLQFQSINVENMSTAGTAKTLTMTLTDDGYTFPGVTGSAVSLGSSFGGSLTSSAAGDTATFQSFVAAPATTTGLQSYTAPASTPGTTSFSTNVAPVTFVRGASYDLRNVTTISLTNPNEQANLSGTTSVAIVPEPAMIGLAGVAGTMLVARRRRTAATPARA